MAEIVVFAAVLIVTIGTASLGIYGCGYSIVAFFRKRRERREISVNIVSFTVPNFDVNDENGNSTAKKNTSSLHRCLPLVSFLKSSERNKKRKKKNSKVEVRFMPNGRTEVNGCIIFDDNICPICLDEVKPGDKMILLSCRHAMHENCVKPWITIHFNCPICKVDLRTPVLSNQIAPVSTVLDVPENSNENDGNRNEATFT